MVSVLKEFVENFGCTSCSWQQLSEMLKAVDSVSFLKMNAQAGNLERQILNKPLDGIAVHLNTELCCRQLRVLCSRRKNGTRVRNGSKIPVPLEWVCWVFGDRIFGVR